MEKFRPTPKGPRGVTSQRYIAASLSYLHNELELELEQDAYPLPFTSETGLTCYAEATYGISRSSLFKYLYVGGLALEPVALGSFEADRDYYLNHEPADLDVHSVFFKYLPCKDLGIDFGVSQLFETLYLFTDEASRDAKAGSALSFFIEMIKDGDLDPCTSDAEDVRFAVYLALAKAKGERPTAFGFHEYKSRFNVRFSNFILDAYNYYHGGCCPDDE